MNIEQTLHQATTQHNKGELAAAAQLCKSVLTVDPNQPEALNLLATISHQGGDPAAAVDLYRRAIAICPKLPEYHFNLGLALRDLKRRDDAAAVFRHAAGLPTDSTLLYRSLASAFGGLDLMRDAEMCLRRALEVSPNDGHIRYLLSLACSVQGKYDQGLQAAREAVAAEPTEPFYHQNLGLFLLRNGNLKAGWPELEYRKRSPDGVPQAVKHIPEWEGQSTGDKTLLLYADGGFGDTFLFARYIPLIQDRAARIILRCQKGLAPLMLSVPGIERIITSDEPVPPVDWRFSLTSLPALFQTTLETIPAKVPYLVVPAERIYQWSSRIPRDGRLNVGLCWSGNREPGTDPHRSCKISDLLPLASVPNVRFFSLQVGGEAVSEAKEFDSLVDFTPEFTDWADTAAVVQQLDLVISVDTGLVHLTGALARPFWLLTSINSAYQWLLDRSDSPWYPTARIFRQPGFKDWKTPVIQMANELFALSRRRKD